MNKALVTVLIPLRLEEPSELEQLSLTQILAVLYQHPITFMAPVGLDTTWYEERCRGIATVHVERFDWSGHEAFCELLMTSAFYERFEAYEYILNCHLDVFVFRDELEHWCRLGYDFIGAVVYNPMWFRPETLVRRVTGFTQPEYFGNGGFCLKKVATFRRITSRFKRYIDFYHWVRGLRKRGFLDDIFVMNHFPKLSRHFRIPPKSLAQQFGAEYVEGEEEALPFTNQECGTMPFGVHGWIQYNQDYWKPCIRQMGYAI
jgi:hypothetical protein